MHPLSADLWELGKSNMTQQAPFVSGSPTSESAAGAIIPSLGRLEALVLGLYRSAGPNGLTDEESYQGAIITVPYLKDSSVRARRISLTRAGYLKDSGATRLSQAKRSMAVWVIVEP